jgi:S1-C subfamily serine protease
MIAGRKVENEAELKALVSKLKPGEKFEGVLVQSDVRTVTVTLGEAK